ncbi:MAG: hypothetical protein NT154_13760 [Verrucomicrobia bacterium]|nr:hypothetical protein [Verrucomicrobiota bacterium]
MKMIKLFSMSVGAIVAFGIRADANAAERLQNIVKRVSASEAQTTSNAVSMFRIAGTVVDAEGRPVTGAVVKCYQQGSASPLVGSPDMTGIWPKT